MTRTPNGAAPVSTDGREPYLLVVRHGPYYGMDVLAHFARTFGRTFEGELCTFGPEQTFEKHGRFRVLRYCIPDGSSRLKRVLYIARVLLRAWRARWILGRPLVVIAYDPFQSGLIGLAAKWTAGAKFICEVNGYYGDPANLIDLPDPEAREAKRTKMLRFGSRILRRADLIKILFPRQLDGFFVSDGVPPRRCFFDMVDDSRFNFRVADQQDRLLFVGHPFLRKGVDILLEAFSRVRGEYPGWELLIVGWRVEEAARARDFSFEQVRFLEPQPAEALAELMETSKAIVLPSRSEGLPRVLLEAALKGRARIASDVAGIPRAIEHDVDGLLFSSEDIEGLAAQLRRIMSEPELPGRLGMAARRRAEMEFTSTAYLAHYHEAVGAVLSGPGRSSRPLGPGAV